MRSIEVRGAGRYRKKGEAVDGEAIRKLVLKVSNGLMAEEDKQYIQEEQLKKGGGDIANKAYFNGISHAGK